METLEQKAVLDRIEDATWAVLLVGESQTERIIPVEQLPEGASEGTWLRIRIKEDVIIDIVVDTEETGAVRGRIASKMDTLRQRKRHFQPIASDDENVKLGTPEERESSPTAPTEGASEATEPEAG